MEFKDENIVCYIVSDTHIGKRFALHEGEWRKPKDVAGVDLGPDVTGFGGIRARSEPGHYVFKHGLIVLDNNDLETRYQLRKMFSNPENVKTCRVQGVSNQDLSKAKKIGRYEGIGTLYDLGYAERTEHNFHDAKRGSMIIDCDGWDVNYDVIDNDAQITFDMRRRFQEAGRDELASADFTFQTSQSYGILTRRKISGHIEVITDEPMTLAEQEQYAVFLNQCLIEAGETGNGTDGGPIDTGIYFGNSAVFSHPPILFKKVGDDFEFLDGPQIDVVRKCEGLYDKLYIPDDLEIEPRVHTGYGVSSKKGGGGQRWSRVLEDHNFNKGMMALVEDAAKASVVYFEEDDRSKAYEGIRRAIIEAPTAYPERLQKRLDEFDRGFQRWWLRGRYGGTFAIAKDNSVVQEQLTLEEARTKLQGYISEALEVDANWEETQKGAIIKSARPIYIIEGPTGIGKSTAFTRAIGSYLDNMKIWFSSGLTTTTGELYDKVTSTHSDMRDHVRHLKGRKQHCHPEMDEKCDKFEKIGQSPRNIVCPVCPHKDTCGWPAEKLDNRVGLDMGQHAHLTTSISAIKSKDSEKKHDVYVLDETVLPTFTENERVRSLEHLREVTSRTNVYVQHTDRVMHEETSDLRAARDEILRALEDADQGERLRILSLGGVTRWIDDYISLERGVAGHYRTKVLRLADADDFNPEAKTVKNLVDLQECAEMFADMGRAIKASKEADRDFVFCVFRYDRSGKPMILTEVMKSIPVALDTSGIICFDATPDHNLYMEKNMWGAHRTIRHRQVELKAQHYYLTQYADRQYTTSMFNTDPEGGVRHNVRFLSLYIKRKATKFKKVLVVTTSRIRELLLEQHTFPAHVHFSLDDRPIYFGNLRGIDAFKDVDCYIQVGALFQKPHVIENKAETIAMNDPDVKAIERLPFDKPLPKRKEWRQLRSGRKVQVEHPYHPDPIANRVLHQNTWAECSQALGRTRPLERNASNPVDITVFGTFDTGLQISDLRMWRDEKQPLETFMQMCEDHGILFPPSCPLTPLMFYNYLETFSPQAVTRAIAIQSKHPRDWEKFSFLYDGARQFVYAKRGYCNDNGNLTLRIARITGVRIENFRKMGQ